MRLTAQLKAVPWSDQVAGLTRSIFRIYLPTGGCLFLVFLLTRRFDEVTFALLSSDTLGDPSIPIYKGVLSNLGILVWCATAVICSYTAVVLRQVGTSGDVRRFLLCSAGLTFVLLFDDFFQLHENLSEKLGVPGTVIFLTYFTLFVALFLRFWPIIQTTPFSVLLLAISCFAASAFIDTFMGDMPYQIAIEDTFKLLGIMGWFGYFVPLSADELQRRLTSHPPSFSPNQASRRGN